MPIGTSNGEYFEDENDHAYQTHFAGKITDPVKVPDSFSNAPAASTAPSRGIVGGNLGEILGMDAHDIPEGMGAREFFKQLQEKTASDFKKPVITPSNTQGIKGGHGDTNTLSLAEKLESERPLTTEEISHYTPIKGLDPSLQADIQDDRNHPARELDSEDLKTLFYKSQHESETVDNKPTTSLSRDAGINDVGFKESFENFKNTLNRLGRTKTFEEAHDMSDEEFDDWFKNGGIIVDGKSPDIKTKDRTMPRM